MKTKRYRNKKKKNKSKTKRIRQTNKFIKLNCSPENGNNNYTCYTDEDLHKLKNIWNERHPDKPITTNKPQEIWNILKNYYRTICNKESCWVKQIANGTKMEKELLESFAPQAPEEWKKNPTEWLSSLDILQVMNQYEKKYKCFEFMGPSPIDYDTHKLYGDCVWEELCHFNLQEQINKGKTKIGVIFNTDPHYKSGSHWVSLFINIKKGEIFYFDSAGSDIPHQIQKLVNNIIRQGNNSKQIIHFKFDKNYPIDHQQNSYSCGVYSLFFIVHMLEDKLTGHYLKTHRLKDKYIEKFRKIYFNEEL
jgi:hypothetical protein